jgi:hypothetical protein
MDETQGEHPGFYKSYARNIIWSMILGFCTTVDNDLCSALSQFE